MRIVALDRALQRQLPPGEWEAVATMIGQLFDVYEVDENGSAWVEKTWTLPDGEHMSHSLALSPEEMELA